MSILIKGMEMPKEDEEIIIRIDSDGTVMTEYALPISGTKAVSVPPHGRLIDADALIKPKNQHIDVHSDEWYVEVRTIDDAPTIIPAEEGEI